MVDYQQFLDYDNFKIKVVERGNSIRLNSIHYDKALFLLLRELEKFLQIKRLGRILVQSEFGFEVNLNNDYNPNNEGEVVIKIEKEGERYFITETGFKNFIESVKNLKETKV